MADDLDRTSDEIHGAGRAIVRDERTGRAYVSPYRYQRQFEAEFDDASHRMIRQHGTPTERFALWFAGVVGGFLGLAFQATYFGLQLVGVSLLQSAVLTGIMVGVIGVLLALALWWGLRGRTRFRKRLIEQRLCFDCGYALIGAPTDEQGRGRCPECGKAFRVAAYLRPRKRYHRAAPVRWPAPQPARESNDGV